MLHPREQHYTGNYGTQAEDRYADLWRAVRAMWAENAAWHAGRDDKGQSQPLPTEAINNYQEVELIKITER